MNVHHGKWATRLFKFRVEYPNPSGSSAPLLSPLIFGRKRGDLHDTKQRGHNFTKNNRVIAFTNVVV